MPTDSTPAPHRVSVAGLVLAGLIPFAVAIAPAAVAGPGQPHPSTSAASGKAVDRAAALPASRRLAVADAADGYVAQAAPNRRHGRTRMLVVTGKRHDRKVTYVKFRVLGIPRTAVVVAETLRFTSDRGRLPASKLSLYRVNPHGWTQDNLVARRAPRLHHRIATTHSTPSRRVVSFHLRRAIRHNGLYGFGVRSSARRAAVRFQSHEARRAPQLLVTYVDPTLHKGPRPSPTPTPVPSSPSAAPTPVSSSSPPDSPAPAPSSDPSGNPTPAPSSDPSAAPSPVPSSSAPVTPAPVPSSSAPLTPTPAPSSSPPVTASPSCTLSAKLVPSCGVLFGGVATTWGGADLKSRYDAAVAGTGTHIVLAHDYRRPGQVLSPYDISLARTPGAILQLNWKPASVWSDAAGGNATVNSQIDAMATSIKSLGVPIFLTIFHEPENDVTQDSNCPGLTYKGTAGTPTDYRAMWANVEARFKALGVTNVVWDMNYMNYAPWDCLVDDLWPGNSLVDWVFFESYSDNTSSFAARTSHFYNLLTSHSNAAHDYLSKPWGIGEFGTSATDNTIRNTYFSGVKTALDTNEFPKLKLLSFFDNVGIGGNFQVGYDANSQADPTELADFMTVATDPVVTQGEATVGAG